MIATLYLYIQTDIMTFLFICKFIYFIMTNNMLTWHYIIFVFFFYILSFSYYVVFVYYIYIFFLYFIFVKRILSNFESIFCTFRYNYNDFFTKLFVLQIINIQQKLDYIFIIYVFIFLFFFCYFLNYFLKFFVFINLIK